MKICGAIFTSPISISIAKKYEIPFRSKLANVFNEIKWLGIVYDEAEKEACDALIGLVLTGGTEHIVLSHANKVKYLVLIYHKYYNSLPATLEVLPVLKKIGIKTVTISYEDSFSDKMNVVKSVLYTIDRLSKAKFALVGGISPWLVYSRVDRDYLRRVFGVKVIDVPLDRVFSMYKDTSVSEEEYIKLIRDSTSLHVDKESIGNAYRLYKVLKNILKEKGKVDGFTIKCFDLISVLNTTACLALSLFNTKKDIIAGCEGDIPSLIAMSIASWISDRPAFMGNIAWVGDDYIVIAHCTAPLISKYHLYTHFESGKGVGIRVDYPVGEEVTILRFNDSMDLLRIGTGVVRRREWSNQLCRTQVEIQISNARKLIDESIGNHYVVIQGNYLEHLSLFAKLLGIKIDII